MQLEVDMGFKSIASGADILGELNGDTEECKWVKVNLIIRNLANNQNLFAHPSGRPKTPARPVSGMTRHGEADRSGLNS